MRIRNSLRAASQVNERVDANSHLFHSGGQQFGELVPGNGDELVRTIGQRLLEAFVAVAVALGDNHCFEE